MLIAVAVEPWRRVPVADTFADGSVVTELYTGRQFTVADGLIALNDYPARVAVFTR